MGKYVVRLSSHERISLTQMVKTGRRAARAIIHARILLLTDEGESGPGLTDTEVADKLEIGLRTVGRVRQRFVEEGVEGATERRKYSLRVPRKKIDGELEARIIAISCSEAPDGFARWSLRLLADRIVELGLIDEISHETVRQTLKKTN